MWGRRIEPISGSSPVLAVPSALIAEEWNYVLNPAHPQFEQLVIGKVEPFSYDPRLA